MKRMWIANETCRNLVLNPNTILRRADVHQLLESQEEVPPEQQEWSSRLDQEDPEPPHIKEEQEELWTSQEGEQLQGLEEADITKFPFTPVPVKSEDDEEKPQSSQLHQTPTEENREAEPLTSSSTQHMETEADGDECGGSEPASNSDPLLQPDTDDQLLDSPEPETDDSEDWKQTRETQSNFNSPLSDTGCTIGKDPINCSTCGKNFHSKSCLNRHMRVHTGEKPFGCSVCKKHYVCSGTLSIHMRIHTGEKPFSCSVCNRSFTQRHTLIRHTRRHTGEKPFRCSVCAERFTWYYQVENHKCVGGRSRSPETQTEGSEETREPLDIAENSKGDVSHTGNKKFRCSECGKLFVHKSNMQRHTRCHTGEKPFGCSSCGNRFRQRSDLVAHFRIHTGVKLFTCSVCGTGFTRRDTLVQHMRTHTGEKPFICPVCGRSFSHNSNLKKHTTAHTARRNCSAAVFVTEDPLQDAGSSVLVSTAAVNEAAGL